MQALAERVEPRRPARPAEERREREVGADERVAAQVRLVGGVGEEAGDGDDADEHEQHRAEHGREPRPAQRRAPEAGPERARRRGDHGRSSRANQRPPASSRPRGHSPAASASASIPSAPTVAQPNQRLIAPGASSRTRSQRVGRPGGVVSTRTRPPGATSSAARAQERDGRAADPDVPVEQERGPPGAGGRHVGEHVAEHRLGPAGAGEPDGDRREVEPERRAAGGDERRDVTARPAADVEHRVGREREQRAVGDVDRREPAPERERRGVAAGDPHAGGDRLPARGRRGEQAAVEELGRLEPRWRVFMPPRSAGRAAKRLPGAASAAARAAAMSSTSRSAGSSTVSQARARAAARAGARRCRRGSSGRPANAAGSGARRPIPQ